VLKRFDYDCRLVPCRALVVDDDAANRRLLRGLLEREHWIVVEAEDGAAAMALVEHTPPDLILLDLMMPTMDGFEVAERLHRDERWRNIPVVVVTAKDLTDEDRRRLNGSVMRVVQKAGGPDDLVKALKDLTERRPLPGGTPALPFGAAPEAPDPALDDERGKELDPDAAPVAEEREMAKDNSADGPDGR